MPSSPAFSRSRRKTRMRIGPYCLANNLLLAPMAGVTDQPFRQLCRELGAGLAVSEMITSQSRLWCQTKSRRRLDHSGERSPISVQLVGTDPCLLAEAAKRSADLGADIVDINMGCPAKKVCRVEAGSALLKDPLLVGRILSAVAAAVAIPVTVKIRTGWDPQHRNGVEVARIAESSGIQAIAVHGRTRACAFSGEAEYETIRAIKSAVRIPVIANGDIRNPEVARKALDTTGADGIMIGRWARGRPWIFREIEHYLLTGTRLPQPPVDWTHKIVLTHLDRLYSFYGRVWGVRIARKHVGWYISSLEGGAELRKQINATDSAEQQTRLVNAFFHHITRTRDRAA